MITANVEITRHDQGDKGEYHAHVSGSDAVGRLTWVKRADGARVAEHTLVPPEIGGRGIAGELVKELVADARENDFKIVPQCSYVAAKFDKNPEWADLLA
jgi:predicted GNAT family acetyltransferase